MVEAGLTKTMIATAVSKANLELRSGHDEMFRWLEKEGVPFLVFSAGIAGEILGEEGIKTSITSLELPRFD